MGGQVLVGKWGRVPDEGGSTKFSPTGGNPPPPGKNPDTGTDTCFLYSSTPFSYYVAWSRMQVKVVAFMLLDP